MNFDFILVLIASLLSTEVIKRAIEKIAQYLSQEESKLSKYPRLILGVSVSLIFGALAQNGVFGLDPNINVWLQPLIVKAVYDFIHSDLLKQK